MFASFVIPCKGRLDHLKETIFTKISQSTLTDYEIIVVDYSCPDATYEWCNQLHVPGLRAISVYASNSYFNNSHCRNVGAFAAKGDVLCFSDADCFLADCWLSYIEGLFKKNPQLIGVGNDFRADDEQKGRGTWAVKKSVWQRMRGYDESMEGWGAEELDFFWRMHRQGLVKPYPREMAWTIKHGDEDRVAFYDEKNKHTSNMENFGRARDQRRMVNGAGFGELDRNRSLYSEN